MNEARHGHAAARGPLVLALLSLIAACSTGVRPSMQIVDPFAGIEDDVARSEAPGGYVLRPGDALDVIFGVVSEPIDKYRIQVRDEVQVRYLGLAEYDSQQVVRPDGRITLPFLGDLIVAGSTPGEATDEIRKGYRGVLSVPDVYLTVTRSNVVIDDLKRVFDSDRGQGRRAVVRPDGFVTLPVIGDVEAAGRTVPALTEAVNGRYRELYPFAEVDVIVQDTAGSQYVVLGEVERPGAFPGTRDMTVLELIALAGGHTIDAVLSTVVTMRPHGSSMSCAVIDVDGMMDLENGVQIAQLRPGDIVFVPRTTISSAANFIDQIERLTPWFGGFSFAIPIFDKNN